MYNPWCLILIHWLVKVRFPNLLRTINSAAPGIMSRIQCWSPSRRNSNLWTWIKVQASSLCLNLSWSNPTSRLNLWRLDSILQFLTTGPVVTREVMLSEWSCPTEGNRRTLIHKPPMELDPRVLPDRLLYRNPFFMKRSLQHQKPLLVICQCQKRSLFPVCLF